MSTISAAGSPASLRSTALGESSWQLAVKRAIRDPGELCRVLELPEELVEPARRAASQFGLFVPWELVARIERGNPADPLLRQVLPLGEELADAPGFTRDPLHEADARLADGVLQKYHGRVLLIVTGACPVHCRYCFRRHYPYSDSPHSTQAWQPALAQIAADETIDEVILSGGDPLMVVDSSLAALAQQIAAIPHVQRLRIHTRMPIMIPQRVTAELVDWLTDSRLSPVVVVHANHPNEIDEHVQGALLRLVEAGVTLLNQSVLLRGVNDDARVLAELSHRLLACRTLPYYLHQLDRVAGAAHFEVPEATGKQIIQQMHRTLPGYLVPRYVRETAGGVSKEAIV